MIKVIIIYSILLLLSFYVIYLNIKNIKKKNEEIKELEKLNEEIRKLYDESNKIRKETIEKQKEYRSNDDNTNFDNSLEFLHNLKRT